MRRRRPLRPPPRESVGVGADELLLKARLLLCNSLLLFRPLPRRRRVEGGVCELLLQPGLGELVLLTNQHLKLL